MFPTQLRKRLRTDSLRVNKVTRDIFALDDFYYREISSLTEAGGWSVDFVNKKSYFDKEARRILEVPDDFIPTLKTGYQFYAEEHMQQATELFFECAQGKSFTTEIKMVTYTKKVFWTKAHGKPIKNESGEIVGIRGVFQNIHKEKERESTLQASLDIIEGHNKRLYNFAHIVSHNLRSHVSNLQLTVALFNAEELDEDQSELFENFDVIASNLDTTLKHLNEIITIQTNVDHKREKVIVQEYFDRVKSSIKQLLISSRAIIYTEFSEIEEIEYVPAYFESILLNLITNAIKYRHEDRDPEIKVYTYEEEDHKFLVIQDNGIGIDLEKNEHKLFQMYNTLNDNSESTGLGLFITKNQVEAMGGKISVESKLDKGSKFIVQL